MLLVENLLHRPQLDDPARPFVKRRAFLPGVGSVAEGDEEAADCRLRTGGVAFHDGLEGVDVRPAHLVHLLHLNRESRSNVSRWRIALRSLSGIIKRDFLKAALYKSVRGLIPIVRNLKDLPLVADGLHQPKPHQIFKGFRPFSL